jgi:adenine-specific DNA-methyltransferase
VWASDNYVSNKSKDERPTLWYPIKHPKTGKAVWPEESAVWRYNKEKHSRMEKEERLYWGPGQSYQRPRLKRFLSEVQQGIVPSTWWPFGEVGHNDEGQKELAQILGPKVFPTPKPVRLLKRIVGLATDENGLFLDSFAGSATTAHAVLAQNVIDGGNRRFILVECEDYADKLTAERVRRVIKGYKYQGAQNEELLRENITWSKFSKDSQHQKILDQVQSLENLEAVRFDTINKTIKDGELVVTGEKKVTKKTDGLGGSFVYFTLGDPLDLDKMLSGKSLPDYASIGAWLFHTATGEPLDPKGIKEKQWYLGSCAAYHVWLVYKPELDFLKSRDAALTLSLAEKIAKKKDKRHLVFAPSRFVPNKMLLPLGVEYAPLPFALYRFEKD